MNINHLADKYDLNDLEKQIVEYINNNIHQLKSIGIRQMAKDNFTSTSTIYKLCDKFGFEGYSDMIYHLTSTKDQFISDDSQYQEHKEKFLSLISGDKLIIIFGLGFSTPIAEYMHQRLTIKGYRSLCVVHMEMFQNLLDLDAVFIVISHSGKTLHLMEIINFANNSNIPVISFIGNKNSPIYEHTTLPIVIGEYDSFSYDLTKKNTFFGESLIVFENLLFD